MINIISRFIDCLVVLLNIGWYTGYWLIGSKYTYIDWYEFDHFPPRKIAKDLFQYKWFSLLVLWDVNGSVQETFSSFQLFASLNGILL